MIGACETTMACRGMVLVVAFVPGVLLRTAPVPGGETAEERAVGRPAEAAMWRVQFVGGSDVSTDDANGEPAPAENETERTIEGRLLVEAADGGILIEDRAGRLWNITPAQLTNREPMGIQFEPFSKDELAAHLLSELGDEFSVVTTEHYVIATSGSRAHAEWCGTLLERLQRAFVRYWRAAGMEVAAPSAPLSVIVHGTREAYAVSAQEDGGGELIDAHGYYSMKTNRVVLVDGTSGRLASGSGGGAQTRAAIRRLLAADPAPASTIVHEATHQLAFNSGMHTRYADNPVWFTEGLAMYFEVPDLRNGAGWRTIGRVNRPRLNKFRQMVRQGRPNDALTSLIADDERFRNPDTVEAAYAEAWALTHYLIKTHRRQYVTFLKKCSENTPFVWKTRKQRLDEFEQVFGTSPQTLTKELVRYTSRLR